jgi:hypothetical protein
MIGLMINMMFDMEWQFGEQFFFIKKSFEWKHYDKLISCTSNVCKLIYTMNLWEL